MTQPTQSVSNSTSYFSMLSELPAGFCSWGGRAIKCLPMVPAYLATQAIYVGHVTHSKLGTIPGVAVGSAAFVAGMTIAVIEGKKAYSEYRDIEILDGTWGGVAKHSLKALIGASCAVLGAVTAVICIQQSRASGSSSMSEPQGNHTNTTESNATRVDQATMANATAANVSLVNETLVNKSIVELPLPPAGAQDAFAFKPMPAMIAPPDYPAHVSENDTCYLTN